MTTTDTYQLLPPLTPDEFAALREDIASNGIRVPIDVDETGQILDGHHRAAIAAELGIDCPTRVVPGLTQEGKRSHAIAVNAHRRHLTREQRRQLVADELARDASRSDRAIARLTGADHKTVGAVRRGGWGIPHPEPAAEEELAKAEEKIARGLVRTDYAIAAALLLGKPRGDTIRVLTAVPAEFPREAWDVVVQPRIDAVYSWPGAGRYRHLGLIMLTWQEWPDFDAGLAAAAERELAALGLTGGGAS